MIKQYIYTKLMLTLIILVTSLTACNEAESVTNMPQATDMALEGESAVDFFAALVAMEGELSIPYEDYADQYLSKLKLVAMDGRVKKGSSFNVDYKTIPPFKKIAQTSERKKAFFDYLSPAIEYQNQLIRERRQLLKGIGIKLTQKLPLSSAQQTFMDTLRTRYRIPEESTSLDAVALLLRRVDTLPVSMVLAQAAMESAWGTSRFAREANNLFGQWCFTPGCGLVPTERAEDMNHEVQKFSSIDVAIGAYFLNINSHPSYELTRDIRESMRAKGLPLTGYALVQGLEQYSEHGAKYIESLRRLIRTNNLDEKQISSL